MRRLENEESDFKPFKCFEKTCKARFRDKKYAKSHYNRMHQKVSQIYINMRWQFFNGDNNLNSILFLDNINK